MKTQKIIEALESILNASQFAEGSDPYETEDSNCGEQSMFDSIEDLIKQIKNTHKMNNQNKVNLELTVQQAKAMYKTADSTMKQLLEANIPKNQLIDNITEIIKDFFDILNWHNMTIETFNKSVVNLSEKEVAFRKLQLIEKCLNNGESFGDYVYWPYFTKNKTGLGFLGSSCHCDYSDGAVAQFVSRKVSDHAGKTFLSIYQDFIFG